MSYGKHKVEHILQKTPSLNNDGNLVANVNHRTGTLNSLLSLAGGAGEISVATDYRAIVRHNGVANEALAFYASADFLALVAERTSLLSCANATDVVVSAFNAKRVDPLGICNIANGEITIPSGYSGMSLMLSAVWNDAAVASSNKRKVWMQVDVTGSGFWLDFGTPLVINSVISTATFMTYNVPDFGDNITSIAGKKLRLVVRQESGGTINLNNGFLAIRLRK